jgi:hypothetical protein
MKDQFHTVIVALLWKKILMLDVSSHTIFHYKHNAQTMDDIFNLPRFLLSM